MQTHDTASSAWKALKRTGGIDVTGRDLPLVELLEQRLGASPGELERALSETTIEGFLNALFSVVSPFVNMMEDLLEYFEAANATQGPIAWNLRLGNGEEQLTVNLDHFRKWISACERRLESKRLVPVLTYRELWAVREKFFSLNQNYDEASPWNASPFPRSIEPELEKWLAAYRAGHYPPLPGLVQRLAARTDAIGDTASIVSEIYYAITNIARTRETLRERGYAVPDPGRDMLDALWTSWGRRELYLFESDYWIGGRLTDLAAWEQGADEVRRGIAQALAEQYSHSPKRPARFAIDVEDLAEILSLPIWKRRYELYSAWLFTLILGGLKEHSINLEHDNGKLEFAFKETLLAIVTSVEPNVKIFSEKRVKSDVPLTGHGRVRSIQPDYSAWAESDICRFAVEAKHYKKSSRSNFLGAVGDYANALRGATIILANYGPVGSGIGDSLENSGWGHRCAAIGEVFPGEVVACRRFQERVAMAIGPPDPPIAIPLEAGFFDAPPVLLLDVSGSMKSFLQSHSTAMLVQKMVSRFRVKSIAAADESLLARDLKPTAFSAATGIHSTGSTNLAAPVAELLTPDQPLLILTDADGAATVPDLPRSCRKQEAIEAGLFLLAIQIR